MVVIVTGQRHGCDRDWSIKDMVVIVTLTSHGNRKSIHIHTHVYTCMSIYICICIYVHICRLHMRMHNCITTHVHACILTYTTYIHTTCYVHSESTRECAPRHVVPSRASVQSTLAVGYGQHLVSPS
jgi:hypothetical protein